MNNDTRFANQYNIQWFPGHMTKTLRMMETEIQHVDASLVLLDARIPLSSLNPEVERITARKPKLYVLNKADLAAFFGDRGKKGCAGSKKNSFAIRFISTAPRQCILKKITVIIGAAAVIKKVVFLIAAFNSAVKKNHWFIWQAFKI